MSTNVQSIDARSGVRRAVAQNSTAEEIAEICIAASAASARLAAADRAERSAMLRAMADRLETDREDIISAADRETALGVSRLNGELTRTTFQLRLFADVLEEGSYLEATIDTAEATAMGPRPDLRRMLVPLGAVAVFGSSNFPLAFSVPGGDTASALAAGNAVVLKVHSSHPETSQLCAKALRQGALDSGFPADVVGLVFGRDATRHLVTDPRIKAVGFTGSLTGGQAILEYIDEREDPIPFYGELSSLNPFIVTEAAARSRASEIGRGLAESMTMGGGQFCTKPGLAFVPLGPGGDALMQALRLAVASTPSFTLLNERITRDYEAGVQALKTGGIASLVGEGPDSPGGAVPAMVFEVGTDAVPDIAQECFGPVTIVVRYNSIDDLERVLQSLTGSLTASIHHADGEDASVLRLIEAVREGVGRLVFNSYPTGVAVSWAQTHGGPWPSTNTLHTSVGATSIRRFLRPMTWQSAADVFLPAELRDAYTNIPRRINGQLLSLEQARI
ncbi:aldehyde dehydrogenase (NADP(+)) [Pseudarthrobacter sp. fls2-241-R2A-168]|uniref:aldehyde dehydrogenase (NADP(+)) n=1 Tax=Pseudarthrobacter sp. fls2-241-R2A-168 TaxID=3040304 RepID=UPI002553D629|nr:aldehyde dehydrogenase (NADP(+)) [Pseudarthrobacter sp. fls2-241-R2A-168]